jgi:hypothetical protein
MLLLLDIIDCFAGLMRWLRFAARQLCRDHAYTGGEARLGGRMLRLVIEFHRLHAAHIASAIIVRRITLFQLPRAGFDILFGLS